MDLVTKYCSEINEGIIKESHFIENKFRYSIGRGLCDKDSFIMRQLINTGDCNIYEIMKHQGNSYYSPDLKGVCVEK